MIVEYKEEMPGWAITFSTEELGNLLFAFDITIECASEPKNQKRALEMRQEIIEKMGK